MGCSLMVAAAFHSYTLVSRFGRLILLTLHDVTPVTVAFPSPGKPEGELWVLTWPPGSGELERRSKHHRLSILGAPLVIPFLIDNELQAHPCQHPS